METYIKLHRKDGKMKKKDGIKIVTIGGGSSNTPELIERFNKRKK